MCLRSLLVSLLSIILLLGAPAPSLALGGELPPLNAPAPDFSLPSSVDGQPISLKDYRGKWVVLYFYPKDFTSGCTLEAQRFQRDIEQFHAHNAEVIGVSADSVDSHEDFCDSEGLTFPLLSDPDGRVSKAYGSWLGFVSLRHSFIIDPEGILRERFVKVNPAIHSQEVLARLEELQQQV
ncbi:peroxiredoxin [Thermosynechococcus sp. PP45]|uniref:peroxiredoxin n=1 Tax=unclassified Thermosynechococcus TaxID=2622553 RepID=UPI00267168DF|nr:MULTISPECIES: peroxiredoxin [unclassified Thermosynechococcus]WKT81426.1 peroxiredoxin [Thermosynechococcus sp. PP45]WKT82838.1 peroxiredoxin [Thermosynechococcus sp. HY596]